MTADVNVTERVARAKAASHDRPVYTIDYDDARTMLSALADPEVLAGIAGVLVQRGLLGCCVDCPVDHRNGGDDQAREVAAAVVEWLRGEQ